MNLRLLRLALSLVPLSVLGAACAINAPAPEGIGTQEQGATAEGTATAGQSCLLSPIYRRDKCVSGIVCNAVGSAPGVCHAIHGESGACDPSFGNANCQSGLTCTTLPDGRGFCMGSGVGRCDAANLGLDCKSGYQCKDGRCTEIGTEGMPCSFDLVENECKGDLECVVPRGRASSDAICTNARAGGVGASCERRNVKGLGTIQTIGCAEGYVCAIASADYWGNITYECRIPGKPGEWCFTPDGCGEDPSRPGKRLQCTKSNVRAGQHNYPGVCQSPPR